MKNNPKTSKRKARDVGFLRFKELGDGYLLTNDFGFHTFLSSKIFNDFIDGKIDKKGFLYEQLTEKGFTKDISFKVENRLINAYRMRNSGLFSVGPGLHIMVVTLRCNYNCVYCQAASRGINEKSYDMDMDTACKTVDFILDTPAKNITIEFQGGEPLANWDVLKFIIEYSRKMAREKDKNLRMSLVSNLSLMNEKRLDFLLKNKVFICTSLDGPEEIHNANRPWVGKNSYKETTKWIKKIVNKKSELENRKEYPITIGVLATVSRKSLEQCESIVDEYLKWGFKSIHFRHLTYLGNANKSQKKIGYSGKEFIESWKRLMDYIISLNKKGIVFSERESNIMLQKILTEVDPNYTDLKSPCGAVLGQMLYNYDGKIYTCDEGRMLGNDVFLTGNIKDSTYKEIVLGSKNKTMMTASCLDNISCDLCVYKPYCGVCPVKHYAYYGNIFPQIKETDFCKIKTAQFDYLFEKIKDEEVKEIFIDWLRSSKAL